MTTTKKFSISGRWKARNCNDREISDRASMVHGGSLNPRRNRKGNDWRWKSPVRKKNGTVPWHGPHIAWNRIPVTRGTAFRSPELRYKSQVSKRTIFVTQIAVDELTNNWWLKIRELQNRMLSRLLTFRLATFTNDREHVCSIVKFKRRTEEWFLQLHSAFVKLYTQFTLSRMKNWLVLDAFILGVVSFWKKRARPE